MCYVLYHCSVTFINLAPTHFFFFFCYKGKFVSFSAWGLAKALKTLISFWKVYVTSVFLSVCYTFLPGGNLVVALLQVTSN